MNAQPNWYCITTNPNCQRRAEAGLAAKGYRVFWPTYRKWASHARTKVAKNYPILGLYVFVEVDTSEGSPQSLGEIRTVDGVFDFVRRFPGAPPAVVDRSWVEDRFLRWLDGEWDFVRQEPCYERDEATGEETVRLNLPIPVGARVRVMEGEWQDAFAKVIGWRNGKCRVVPRGQHKEFRMSPMNLRAA